MYLSSSHIQALLCLLVATFSFSEMVFCQTSNYHVEYFNVRDGLSHRHVTSILQDKKGRIWIGTRSGIDLYDGYQFYNFSSIHEDQLNLDNEVVSAMVEDNNGLIWVGTDLGLKVINPYTKKSTALFPNTKIFDLAIKQNGEILISNNDKKIWVAKDPDSIELFLELSSNIKGIQVDKNGIIWLRGSKRKLYRVQDKQYDSFDVKNIYQGSDKEYFRTKKSFYLDKDDNFYIHFNYCKVFQFDKEKKNFTSIKGDTTTLLCEVEQLLEKYIDQHSELKDIHSQYHLSKRMFIHTIIQDQVNNIWVGTRLGLFKINKKQIQFETPKENNRLSLRNIIETSNGMIYMGSYSGLQKYDPSKKEYVNLNKLLNKKLLSQLGAPRTLLLDKKEKGIWIGSHGRNIHYWDLKTNFLERINSPSYSLKSSIYDHQGKLWFGGDDGLIYSLPKDPKKFYKVSTGKPGTQLLFSIVHSFAQYNNDTILVGTNNGLFLLNTISMKITKYKNQKYSNLFSSLDIYSFTKDSFGNFWMGTFQKGIIILDSALNFNQRLTIKDGLPNSTIYNILQSDENNYWISTDYGLSQYNRSTGVFKNFFTDDGIAHNEFNQGSALKASDGTFYFGGINGLTSFKPKQINENKIPSKPFISKVKKYDTDKNEMIENLIFNEEEGIELFPNDQFVEFSFASDEYSDTRTYRFKYLLEGYNKTWVDNNNINSVQFNNLDPGKYLLRVQSANSSGIWYPEEIKVPIIVHPTFYQTKWFLGLMILSGIGILGLVYTIRIRQIKQIENIRTKIARNLHDDVSNTLNNISIIATMLNNKKLSEHEFDQEVHRIKRLSKEAVINISDVIWTVNTEKEKLDDLIIRLEDVADDYLLPMNIAFKFNIGKFKRNKNLSIQTRQNILLILKEALNNISKHSQASFVTINLYNKDGQFNMSIQNDNANSSYNVDAKNMNIGLASMKYRAKQLSGTIVTKMEDNNFTVTLHTKQID